MINLLLAIFLSSFFVFSNTYAQKLSSFKQLLSIEQKNNQIALKVLDDKTQKIEQYLFSRDWMPLNDYSSAFKAVLTIHQRSEQNKRVLGAILELNPSREVTAMVINVDTRSESFAVFKPDLEVGVFGKNGQIKYQLSPEAFIKNQLTSTIMNQSLKSSINLAPKHDYQFPRASYRDVYSLYEINETYFTTHSKLTISNDQVTSQPVNQNKIQISVGSTHYIVSQKLTESLGYKFLYNLLRNASAHGYHISFSQNIRDKSIENITIHNMRSAWSHDHYAFTRITLYPNNEYFLFYYNNDGDITPDKMSLNQLEMYFDCSSNYL